MLSETPERPENSDLFDLPPSAAAKADPALLGPDPDHLRAVAARIRSRQAELGSELEELRRAPGGRGRAALDRDQSIHRLTRQLGVLERFGPDVVLGRMIFADHPDPVYIGRIGLMDAEDRRLLVDWRAPAAEPFFAATHAEPMGLASRRRYRWGDGRVRDYWDEVFDADRLDGNAALDDQSSFIASLGAARTSQMRDVLATIAADQDAVIRAGARGAMVVEGGPGTGKTVVALHRAAYLLYADPRLDGRAGSVLLVGPHSSYLNYVADVLPSLGEDGVRSATLAEMVPQGPGAVSEADPRVAALKSSARMFEAIDPAVGLYEEIPSATAVETPWADLEITADDWAEAFDAPASGTPHNEAREEIWEALVAILVDKVDPEEVPVERLRTALLDDEELRHTFSTAWPVLDPAETVGDLWTVPAYLRRCAPWLSSQEVAALQRPDPAAWTDADLPLLDAARARIGDPDAGRRERLRRSVLADQRGYMDDLVDYILDTDDDPDSSLAMLRGDDLREALLDEGGVPEAEREPLSGPFAHIIVDEAQELTDAQWQMLLRRCPSRSFTIVGDRAQARSGFQGSWQQRLGALGFRDLTIRRLRVNYRTPAEVMDEAGPMILTQVPDAAVPVSIRHGDPVVHGRAGDLDAVLDRWLAEHPEGTACVIGAGRLRRPRVRALTPQTVKGLEFDLVVIVDPASLGEGRAGAVDRYVSMARTTSQLVILDR